MEIDKNTLDALVEEAKKSPRLRMNKDLRTSSEDKSQRMLNAIEPDSIIPIHRHPNSTETVCVIRGKVRQSYFNEDGTLAETKEIAAGSNCPFYVVPKGMWHKTEALESYTIIFEAKDGKYGEDGSENFKAHKTTPNLITTAFSSNNKFQNSLEDLKKDIENLIVMERHSGNMEVITSLYVSRMLNVPLKEVEVAMKEMEGYI